jgi:hypothetical protein
LFALAVQGRQRQISRRRKHAAVGEFLMPDVLSITLITSDPPLLSAVWQNARSISAERKALPTPGICALSKMFTLMQSARFRPATHDISCWHASAIVWFCPLIPLLLVLL